MGWSFNTGPTGLKDEIRFLTHEGTYKDVVQGDVTQRTRCLTKQFRGNIRFQGNLWTLWERTWTRPDGSEASPAHRFIVLFMMKCVGKCWGWKDVDETCGPYDVNCPISYVERATEPVNEYAKEWREKVREAYRTGPGRKLVVGTTYLLRKNNYNIERVTLTSIKPLIGRTETGYSTRLHKSLILEEVPVLDFKGLWQRLTIADTDRTRRDCLDVQKDKRLDPTMWALFMVAYQAKGNGKRDGWLILADYLDEKGEGETAEMIRGRFAEPKNQDA